MTFAFIGLNFYFLHRFKFLLTKSNWSDYNFFYQKSMNKYLIVATAVTILLAAFSLYEPSEVSKMVNRINTTPGVAWKAGENSYFKDRSVQDIMGIMGTLETP